MTNKHGGYRLPTEGDLMILKGFVDRMTGGLSDDIVTRMADDHLAGVVKYTGRQPATGHVRDAWVKAILDLYHAKED